MSLWQGAKNAVDMMGATMAGLEVIGLLSRSDQHREALGAIRVVCIGLVEGYQGKVTGAKLMTALKSLAGDLETSRGLVTEGVLEAFRSAL